MHKTLDKVRQAGLIILLKKAFKKVKNSCYRNTSSIWFCKNIEESVGSHFSKENIQLKFQLIDEGDLLDWIKDNHSKFPWMYFPEEIDVARQEKHIFASVNHKDLIIGYIKIGKGRVYIHDFDKIVQFPPSSAFIYDIFVLPKYRRKQIALHSITEAIKFISESGYKKVWCHIERWNTASLNTFKKAGFELSGTIRYLRCFSFAIFLKNGCRLPFKYPCDYSCRAEPLSQ